MRATNTTGLGARSALVSGAIALSFIGSSFIGGTAHAWTPTTNPASVWRGSATSFWLNEAGTPDIPIATAEMEVVRAMTDWTTVACSGLRAEYRGKTAIGPTSNDRNFVIGWVESGWRYGDGTIGVTSNIYSGRTIISADMELNGQDFTWITTSGRGSRVNVYSIVLHEGGHFYGLGHSASRTAVMFASYQGGISTITADDQMGICTLYPGEGAVPSDCSTVGCPSGQTCVAGMCQRVAGNGTVCASCTDDAQCQNSGRCITYPDGNMYCGAPCSRTAPCTQDGTSCVFIPSLRGSQCVGLVNRRATCEAVTPSGCTNDSMCEAGQYCNTTTHACEANPTGTGGPMGTACQDGSECASGLCFGGICTSNCNWLDVRSCATGYYCSGNTLSTCGEGVCARVTGTQTKTDGMACTNNLECRSLYCSAGVCSVPCNAAVDQCADGTSCRTSDGRTCGACRASGAANDDCRANEDCASGLCAEARVSPDAPARQFCAQICTSNAQCPGGLVCTATADPNRSVCFPDTSAPAPSADGGVGGTTPTKRGCGCEIASPTRVSNTTMVGLIAAGLCLALARRRVRN